MFYESCALILCARFLHENYVHFGVFSFHSCNYAHPGEALRRPRPEPYFDKDYYTELKQDFPKTQYPFGIYLWTNFDIESIFFEITGITVCFCCRTKGVWISIFMVFIFYIVLPCGIVDLFVIPVQLSYLFSFRVTWGRPLCFITKHFYEQGLCCVWIDLTLLLCPHVSTNVI